MNTLIAVLAFSAIVALTMLIFVHHRAARIIPPPTAYALRVDEKQRESAEEQESDLHRELATIRAASARRQGMSAESRDRERLQMRLDEMNRLLDLRERMGDK